MLSTIKNKIQYLALAAPVYAQNIELDPVGDQFDVLTDFTPARLISAAISLILLVVALVFFFMLVWGGLKWVMSGGDEKNVAAARAQITNALIGLAIVFAAWAIIRLVSIVFGINLLEFTIPQI